MKYLKLFENFEDGESEDNSLNESELIYQLTELANTFGFEKDIDLAENEIAKWSRDEDFVSLYYNSGELWINFNSEITGMSGNDPVQDWLSSYQWSSEFDQEDEFDQEEEFDEDGDYWFNNKKFDLSIELENKLRKMSDDDGMTVNDFVGEFGIKEEDMTDFAWASILNGAQQYKEMTDEEFFKLYDKYKSTFESFLDDMDYQNYLYLVEDIIILEEATAGSVDNPNSKSSKMIKKKSEQSGIPVGILKKVYKRGSAAWNSGHRPGTPQQAWATGRVNSFITGSGGARKADADLWTKAKAAKARKKNK